MSRAPKLKMWLNGVDFVIARDVDQARRLVYHHDTGCDSPECFTEAALKAVDKEGWQECVPDRLFTLHAYDPVEGDSDEVHTVTEWVNSVGHACWFAQEE